MLYFLLETKTVKYYCEPCVIYMNAAMVFMLPTIFLEILHVLGVHEFF